MSPILLHINYFEQGQDTERACQLARDLGADGIEFRRKPPQFKGSDLEYLDEVSCAVEKYRLKIVSFGSPGVNLMDADAGVREKELDSAEEFYRKAASRFPLSVVNASTGPLKNPEAGHSYRDYWRHGSNVASDEHWENAIHGFRRLARLAAQLGFRFAFETHGVYLHDTLTATLRLVDGIASPHVGVLWDQANLMLLKDCPSIDEAIRNAGSKIVYVHLKNFLVAPSEFIALTGLSSGIINIREQVGKLLESGYCGPWCIEAPRSGDRERFAREDIGYLREILSSFE